VNAQNEIEKSEFSKKIQGIKERKENNEVS